ncbi:MAG: hypothetical protein HKN07_03085 [Acidimicrobiia bacterium]|nr:hypothetical protein [Acidimicrobiia bacterium]
MDSQPDITPSGFPNTVLWTKGDGCRELAELLASKDAVAVEGDPNGAGIRHRADMVVMNKVGSFDLLPVAAPTGFDTEKASNIVVAVGKGPNSQLAARLAGRLADRLKLPVEALTAVRPGAPTAPARRLVDQARAPSGMPGRVVEVQSEADLLESVAGSTLLLLGAPGGSWLHRQFFGPGAKLLTAAPAGTIVVRDAPRRAFHLMGEPFGVSRHLLVQDALMILTEAVTPVVDDGQLVGVVRRKALKDAPADGEVADLMETPAYVEATDALHDLADVVEFYESSPIPLVDRRGRLVGLLDPRAVEEGLA